MTEEHDANCFAICMALFAVIFIFGVGWCVGNDVTTKDIRQNVCKNIMTQTDDYIRCNTWNMDVIYKKLGDRNG